MEIEQLDIKNKMHKLIQKLMESSIKKSGHKY